MADDIVRYIECLNLGFVAVEELLADIVGAVGARGIGYPWQVGVGEQIDIHGIAADRFVEPLGNGPESIVEPYLGDDQFGVEEDDRVVVERKRGLLFSGLRPV